MAGFGALAIQRFTFGVGVARAKIGTNRYRFCDLSWQKHKPNRRIACAVVGTAQNERQHCDYQNPQESVNHVVPIYCLALAMLPDIASLPVGTTSC